MIKLFERSIRYSDTLKTDAQSISDLNLLSYNQPLEQQYMLDLSCLAVWDGEFVGTSEYVFIYDLGAKLNKSRAQTD